LTTLRVTAAIALLAALTACGSPSEVDAQSTITVTISDDTLVMDPTTVPAGEISFGITNEGSDVHELEVFAGQLSDVEIVQNIADMSDFELIDEVEDIVPGSFLTLDVTLEPGQYVVMSNYPGEVADGLVAELTVTG
jgi:uncharacterized cupredoxin-like copper-binding protein